MRGIRVSLRLAAAFTVAIQLATPTLASAALCCKDPAALSGKTAELMECCKKGGAHICPMKKAGSTQTATADEGAKRSDQAMRSCCVPDTKLFAALLGTLSLAAAEPYALVPPTDPQASDITAGVMPLWAPSSTSPPPKA